MGLLSDLREFLRQLRMGRTQLLAELTELNIDGLRRIIFDACARDDQREHPMRMFHRQRYDLLEKTDELIYELVQCIADRHNFSLDELGALLPFALTETLDTYARLQLDGDQKISGLSSSQESIIYHCCESAWATFEERRSRDLQSPREYALELGLVDIVNKRPRISAAGEDFLRLVGSDAIRWILARELSGSLDRDDRWRGHSSVAEVLKTRGKLQAYDFEFQYDTGWPWNNPALPRWTDMGVLAKMRWERGDNEPDGGISYALSELGSRIFTELLWSDDIAVHVATRSQAVLALDQQSSAAAGSSARFRFSHLVGKGGWAEVWRAEDLMLRRDVAIKLFEPGGTHIAGASGHAQALARVNHPNVVKIYDVCALPHPESREPWNAIVMELLEGPTLAAMLAGDVQYGAVAELCRGILNGLGALHGAGIVHSDVHGENIVLHNGIPKILDALYRGTLAACSGTEKHHLMKRDLQQVASEIAAIITHSGHREAASEFRALAKDADSTAALTAIVDKLFALPLG